MATCDYSADSALLPPPRPVFTSGPELSGAGVFVFERGFVPARKTFPRLSIIA